MGVEEMILEEIVCGGEMLLCKEFIPYNGNPKFFAVVNNDLYRVNSEGVYTLLMKDFKDKVENETT